MISGHIAAWPFYWIPFSDLEHPFKNSDLQIHSSDGMMSISHSGFKLVKHVILIWISDTNTIFVPCNEFKLFINAPTCSKNFI